MAAAVGLSASLLALHATGAEAPPVQKTPAAAELVDAPLFRAAIEGYLREHGRQLRETLNEDLRREVSGKIVLSTNELRARS